MSSVSSNALLPLSAAYGVVTRARLALYRSGLLPTHQIAAPVISVGNITAGGTGKTPLVEWLARAVAREGKRVCVLSRGYKRTDEREHVLVSDGKQLLTGAREGGDEPRLLAEKLLGIAAVLSDADRIGAARWAQENLASEVFILDDGFQHLRLKRDLNIVALDGTNPWGGGHLLPRGRLREPLHELRRADCIVITRAETVSDLLELRDIAARLSAGRPVLSTRTQTSGVRPLHTQSHGALQSAVSLPQPFAAFCALGNPQAFFTHARRSQLQLTHTRAFPDHHAYTQNDIDALSREAASKGVQAFLTTAKDAVKLRHLSFPLPCFVLEIELVFDDELKMLELMRQAIRVDAAP